MSIISCTFDLSNKNNMENLIRKFKKQGTLALLKKQEKESGQELAAIEIVLISRNQPFQAKTPIETISEQMNLPKDHLIERGYFVTKPKKEKVKKNPLALNEGERHFLSTLMNLGEERSSDRLAPTFSVELNDLDKSVIPNGARYAGVVKSLVKRGFILSTFEPSFETGKVNSTMQITSKGLEAYEAEVGKKFKLVKKNFKEIDEEEMEGIELESLQTKKQMFGKFVSFKANVTGESLVGLVTGTKIDKRTGYVYLNIRIGKNRFNKRPGLVEIEDKTPLWFSAEKEHKTRMSNLKKKDKESKNSLNTTNEEINDNN